MLFRRCGTARSAYTGGNPSSTDHRPAMSDSATKTRMEPSLRGQDNPFLVDSRLEILHLLHAIMREASLISVNIGVNDFFLTSVMDIDEDNDCLYLERGRGRPPLSNALQSRTLWYDTTLDKIKIRFASTGIATVTHAGGEAYRICLPQAITRIQRREHYRAVTPMVTPLKCRISIGENAGDAPPAEAGAIELAVCDISCGGLAIQTPPAIFAPELGVRYACTLLLPDTSGLRMTVQARNAYMQTLRSGKILQRCGFAYLNAPESSLAAIQRYILHLERQLRTRAAR
jgi:flagellar brake protein